MGQSTETRYWCDWCKTDLTHLLGKGVFAYELLGDKICADCLKMLRAQVREWRNG